MKYEEFQGPVEELVLLKLREIEEKEKARIITEAVMWMCGYFTKNI